MNYFRAWTGSRFTTDFSINAETGEVFWISRECIEYETWPVSRNTFFKDKNGQYIFEKDKVLCKDGKVREVYYDSELMAFQIGIYASITDQEAGFTSEELEIVGHAYQKVF